jgi:hypothetical protein
MVYSSVSMRFLCVMLVSIFAAPSWAQSDGVGAAQTNVQVQSLGQVEPFEVGALAGIPYEMPKRQWQGTGADIAARLMSDLPERGVSPLLNRLAASVLISPSTPPIDGAGDMMLASLRLASVYRLGQLDAVINLAERSPGGLSDPENAAIATQAFLALGKDTEACETAIRLQNGRGAVFWLKVRAFCLAREGRTAAAELTADLVLEADPDDIDFLLSLNRMLRRDQQPVKPINALELAMARFAGAPIDLAEAPFSLKSAFLDAPGLGGLETARMMAAAGLLSSEKLAMLYMNWNDPALPVPDLTEAPAQNEVVEDDFAHSDAEEAPQIDDEAMLAFALSQSDPARAALIYQSAARASNDHARAKAIFAGLRHEKDLGAFFATAQLYAPLLARTDPESLQGDAAMARTFAYALLVAGRPMQARAFVFAAGDEDTRRLLRLYEKGYALADFDKAKNIDLTYTDLMAFYGLGVPLTDGLRDYVFTHSADREEVAPCRAGAMVAIMDGAAHKARAASFLRAALILADSGFDGVEAQCGSTVVAAFKAMGYEDLARQAALEMMLGPRLRTLNTLSE